MTVFNTSYSSIDEAFGYLNPDLQKKSKKKNKDPLCELYNQKWQPDNLSNSLKDDVDLISYANEYKNPNLTTNRDTSPKYIDISDKPINNKDQEYSWMHPEKSLTTKAENFEMNYDFQPSKMIAQEDRSHQERYTHGERYTPGERYTHQERYIPEERYSHQEMCAPQEMREPHGRYCDEDTIIRLLSQKYDKKTNNDKINYIDLILYIISGIILIFILEQFIQIGMNMK